MENRPSAWWRPLPEPDISRPFKALIITAALIAFCGINGWGYYEHEQVWASSKTPTAILSVASDYKGQTRFISQTDARIYNLSMWCFFGGGGICASLSLLAYGLDYRRRSRATPAES